MAADVATTGRREIPGIKDSGTTRLSAAPAAKAPERPDAPVVRIPGVSPPNDLPPPVPVLPAGATATRRAARTPTPNDAPKVKVSLRLTPEAAERLGIHAIKARRTQSDMVEELIRQNLRRYVVQDRGGASGAVLPN